MVIYRQKTVRTFKRGFLSDDAVAEVADFDSIQVVCMDVERAARYGDSTVREFHLVLTYEYTTISETRVLLQIQSINQ